jgi:hypothetical protein
MIFRSRLHHWRTPQETTTPTAPARSGQAVRRGTRPVAVLDIRDASLLARLRASAKLAQQQNREDE